LTPNFGDIPLTTITTTQATARVLRTDLSQQNRRMKYWEIIADNLSKAGFSLGWVSARDREGELLKHPASSLCSRKGFRQSITHRTGHAFAQVKFGFWMRAGMSNPRFGSAKRIESYSTRDPLFPRQNGLKISHFVSPADCFG
jgi:hypothetical protein